ncbi:MAG: PIG-L deacetylase family protein [Promethearchaeota archaeon]
MFEAHSDDCVIGMGGTVAKLLDGGWRVVLVTMTMGETAYTRVEGKEAMAAVRRSESLGADGVLGIPGGNHAFLDIPCQSVTNDRDTYWKVVEQVRKWRPEVIFTHQPGSKHRDHRRTSKVVTEAWWKASENVLADLGESFRAGRLLYFEVTDLLPKPSAIVDITPHFAKKMEALAQFTSQLEVLPGIKRFVEGLAMARGYMGGFEYGEAFLESNFIPRGGFEGRWDF